MSKNKGRKSSDRADKVKWFLAYDAFDKITVKKANGRASYDGKEVLHIQASATRSDILKVKFRGNDSAFGFNICLFDFTANDLSRKFEAFVTCTKQFSTRLKAVLVGEKDVATDNSNCLDDQTTAEPNEPTGTTEMATTHDMAHEMPDYNHTSDVSYGLALKRSVPKETPDVDPLPSLVKKQKKASDTPPDAALKDDKQFLEFIKKDCLIREDPYSVHITSLVQPRAEFLIRPLDNMFVEKLKLEFVERCSTFVKPLIAVVKGVSDKHTFEELKLHEYTMEVIGGNHRREAFAQLEKEGKLGKDTPLTIKIQLFTEMSQQQALRLAQLHNREDTIHHELTTSDKVKLCRNLLIKQFGKKKCGNWRNMCSVIIGESESILTNVLFAASDLSDYVYDALLKVLEVYENLNCKGQRASRRALMEHCKKETSAKASFPYTKLKCLRGDLKDDEMVMVLESVSSSEISVPEMESELSRIKEMRALQNYFVKYTECSSWANAKEKYPYHTSEEVLQGFRGELVRGAVRPRFQSFIQRAVKYGSQKDACLTSLIAVDCDEDLGLRTFDEIPNFQGTDLVFLELPKKWKLEQLVKFLRKMRSLNLANNVEETRFIVFPSEAGVVSHLKMACDALEHVNLSYTLAYYHNASEKPKDKCEVRHVMLPFVVSCGPPNTPTTNLISVEKEQIIKEKDTGTASRRQKPVNLYGKLLDLYSKDKSLHVVDACSGAGSCAVACAAHSLKCVVLEKCPLKARLIKQRVNCI